MITTGFVRMKHDSIKRWFYSEGNLDGPPDHVVSGDGAISVCFARMQREKNTALGKKYARYLCGRDPNGVHPYTSTERIRSQCH